jgi:hypothetical protein
MSLPQNVVIPSSSGQFAKLQEGKNRFRVLSDAVIGWEGWKDKKPFRHEGAVCKITAEQVDQNQNGQPNINYFWAFVVYNVLEKKIQVWEVTQKTIMKVLKDFEDSPDWGDLKGYDIEINKTKVGDKTTYTTIAVPPKPVTDEVKELYAKTEIDLQKLFAGEYPMTTESTEDVPFE